jgi:signal peptidase I
VNKEVPMWLARTVTVTALVVGVALLVFLWPTRLGGSSELLVVHGDSMEPTFDHGDIVLVRSSGHYDVGDTVAFRVPSGPAEGMRVVHRIVALDATTGRLTTRGDNRATNDHFEITALDVDGRVLVRIPWAGHVLFVMSRWWVLAAALGALTVLLVWPRPAPQSPLGPSRDERPT